MQRMETHADIEHVKETLFKRVCENDPDVFSDNFQFDILKDPVIVPENGHVYERSEIEFWLSHHPTSPMTRKPRTSDDLRNAPELKKIIHKFLRKKDEILSKISEAEAMEALDSIERDVKKYLVNIKKYAEQFNEISAGYQIDYLKNRDFLDIHNPLHLAHWHEPESRRWGFDTVVVTCQNQKFNIKRTNYRLLIAANKTYPSVEAFHRALSDIRKDDQYRSCWFDWGFCIGPRRHDVTPVEESKHNHVSPH